VAAPGVLGRFDQLHSYSETVGSDWSGDNMDPLEIFEIWATTLNLK
jgi:hypothetical protein